MARARQKKTSPKQALSTAIKPRVRPPAKARIKARLAELAEAATEAGVATNVDQALAKGDLGSFVGSVMEFAPFLRSLVLEDPARLVDSLDGNPGDQMRKLLAATRRAGSASSEESAMAVLRRRRRDVALLVALCDLGGVWDVSEVTKALTEFADAAVGAAARLILREAAADGQIALSDTAKPEEGCGWIILGMGKFGAGELNYSSDIDLIVLYDLDRVSLPEDAEAAPLFVRLTKRLVHMLQEHTADSYVFRTDLRLRPDPGATNIAMSTEAALLYYESLGQNWERAALTKARPVAGDKAAGDAFLAELTPFIWRKYLDYAAIADVHSIKRQIHDHRGHGQVAVAGHNIKLGRGGIRDIEFFVQTQQLIAGGRHPELRGRRTLDMLATLAKGKWIDAATRDDLTKAYNALRAIEHCLQMVNDDQTHTLPEDDEALTVIARMDGFQSCAAFSKALMKTLQTVSERYAALFETAPSLTSAVGSLVFTGDEDDPETLATLSRLGFGAPQEVTRAVRSWHRGHYPATRSGTARERLTEFLPALITALAATDNADTAFKAFDRFLSRLPAGVQLFALLASNTELLRLLATMLGTAPRLAETVIGRAHVLDAVIEPEFFGELPDKTALAERLSASLDQAISYEDLLDRTRIFGQEQMFLIGVRVLAGTVPIRQAGHAYADLAEVILTALLNAVREEFEQVHGRIKGGQVALVAMGKLGGREMTASSDLDLILLYDFSNTATASDGERPLAGTQYFGRLTQRMVSALTAPTAEGTLYEVDFRLRPSGQSGPLATHIDSFAAYQDRGAWTWEHMALTRARVIAGDRRLVARAEQEIAAAVVRKRNRDKVVHDILEMRAIVEEEKGGEGAWDLKQAPGGLVDIEFIAQFLLLQHVAKRQDLLSTETEVVLAAAAEAKLLPAGEAEILLPALRLYQALIQTLRLCVEGVFDPATAPRGLLDHLAQVGELPDFPRLDAHLKETQVAVRGSFERLLGKVPAEAGASGP